MATNAGGAAVDRSGSKRPFTSSHTNVPSAITISRRSRPRFSNQYATSRSTHSESAEWGDNTTTRYRDRSSASLILPHRLGLAARSVLSRNTRSACSLPTLRPMVCKPLWMPWATSTSRRLYERNASYSYT